MSETITGDYSQDNLPTDAQMVTILRGLLNRRRSVIQQNPKANIHNGAWTAEQIRNAEKVGYNRPTSKPLGEFWDAEGEVADYAAVFLSAALLTSHAEESGVKVGEADYQVCEALLNVGSHIMSAYWQHTGTEQARLPADAEEFQPILTGTDVELANRLHRGLAYIDSTATPVAAAAYNAAQYYFDAQPS